MLCGNYNHAYRGVHCEYVFVCIRMCVCACVGVCARVGVGMCAHFSLHIGI